MARRKRVGVVADDITGANDIGVMLAKNGYRTGVFSLSTYPAPSEMAGLDAFVLNTDSRLDTPETAAEKTGRACALLRSLPCDVYHSKTCSVFRGNVGAQFDAMRGALGAACMMVVLGFPKNGRTTLGGIHSVYGVPLAESAFRNDPMHPMTESDLIAILSRQSAGRVRLFDAEALDLPESARRAALDDLKRACEYVLFDVRDQRDLRTIARLIADEPLIGGSSAICEELPQVWLEDTAGTLVVSGSLTPQTKAQAAHLAGRGVPVFALDTAKTLDAASRKALAETLGRAVAETLRGGGDALLCAAQSPEAVAETMRLGRQSGLSDAEIGRAVSAALGGIAAGALGLAGSTRVVVAGGETSAAVSDALGIRRMIILDEIEPGVPAMRGQDAGGNEYRLVFKSGSFGSPAFLSKSIERLRAL